MSGTGMGSSFFILVEIRFIHGYLVVEGRDRETSINTAERCILSHTENGCFLCFSWYSFAPVSYTWICSFFVHWQHEHCLDAVSRVEHHWQQHHSSLCSKLWCNTVSSKVPYHQPGSFFNLQWFHKPWRTTNAKERCCVCVWWHDVVASSDLFCYRSLFVVDCLIYSIRVVLALHKMQEFCTETNDLKLRFRLHRQQECCSCSPTYQQQRKAFYSKQKNRRNPR